ncbi:MAG: cellulase family glycosylhydrolase [Thermoleophilia bacterium]|nr:cellulase family glycosylhydrolase [Thermoleophilia bacterium]
MRRQVKTPRRRMTGIAIATAAAAALAVPATGAGAVAALQDDVLATASLSQIPERLELVKETKTKVARFDILWSLVAPNPPANAANPADPAYDWSRVDAVLSGLAAANITPIVSTYSTPTWAIAGRNDAQTTLYDPDAPTTASFGAFMKAVATRYSGTFTPAGAAAPLPRVRHFEVWNEPNLKGFFRFNGASNLSKYKGLVKAAYTNIKAANRNTIVIGGVGGPRSSNGNGNISARVWLNGLVGDKSVKFDAYSQHIYPSQGPLFNSRSYAKAFPTWASLDQILATLDRKKKGMKLYITEAGYTTAVTPFRKVKVTPANQALYLKQIFNLKTVKSARVAAVVWFNLQDNVNWPAGLINADGTKKPSYAAFRTVAGRPIAPALRAELRR